jgi:hypothetical protein
LAARFQGPAKLRGVERQARLVQAETPARGGEARGDQLRVWPLTLLPLAPFGIVVTPTAHLAHDANDARGAVREMRRQPFAEEIFDLVRHAQNHVAGRGRAGFGRLL